MNGETAMEKLAAALRAHRIAAFSGSEVVCACDHRWRGEAKYREHQTAALLPVVREIAAEELRAAAGALAVGYEPGQVEEWLAATYARADALTKPAP